MLDITSSCRACMKDNLNLIDLYDMVNFEENYYQLADILILCTSTTISKEDGLPQNLCDVCTKTLHTAYSFRKQVEKAHEEFKKLLQTEIKSEPPELHLKVENEHSYFDSFEDFAVDVDLPKVEDIDEGKYTCDKCNKIYLDEKRFLKHLQMHETPLRCSFCMKTYQNQTSLEKHLAKHYTMHTCIICKQTFETEHLLIEHRQVEHIEGNVKIEYEAQESLLQCPDCDLTFTKQRSLSMHRRRHKNKKVEFICDACGKVFGMKQQLKRHVVLHSDVKPYKCSKCPKTYARKDQLVHHMHSHKESKPYECSYCKKSFGQLCSLKDHIRSHTGETPYLCSECGKAFANSSNLRQHMMRHTGLKPYACNMCPKTFCTKGQMTSHMSTHTGEHPYKCEKCGATFTKQNSLKKHSFIHLGIRPFACDTCDMRFTCKDHLKRHYRIHTGEKPYRCKYCERAFSQSNDLVKHTRAHVGQNIYQCTICDLKFRLMSELKSHYPVHFVDGKLQPPETKETDAQLKPPSPTKELDELILKPPELPLLTFNHNNDITLLPSKSGIDKDIPVLTLKPTTPGFGDISEVIQDEKSRYTIIINSCNKNGLVNGITINMKNED